MLTPPSRFIVRAKPSAWLAFAIFWVAASLAAWVLTGGIRTAVLMGVGVSILHWAALSVHHTGHALAARSTGFPMAGVLFWWALATSLYPPDEPDLPASVHVRRALGGPFASIAFAALAGLFAWILWARGFALWPLAGFAALDSLLVFGIGSLVPLGFTDGSTLLRWLRADADPAPRE